MSAHSCVRCRGVSARRPHRLPLRSRWAKFQLSIFILRPLISFGPQFFFAFLCSLSWWHCITCLLSEFSRDKLAFCVICSSAPIQIFLFLSSMEMWMVIMQPVCYIAHALNLHSIQYLNSLSVQVHVYDICAPTIYSFTNSYTKVLRRIVGV